MELTVYELPDKNQQEIEKMRGQRSLESE